jgi:hypothetical protein
MRFVMSVWCDRRPSRRPVFCCYIAGTKSLLFAVKFAVMPFVAILVARLDDPDRAGFGRPIERPDTTEPNTGRRKIV